MSAGEITVTALTNKGAIRPDNEDALIMGATTISTNMNHPARVWVPTNTPTIIGVADGVGGQAAGEIASEHVVSRLAETSPDLHSPDLLAGLLVALDEELSEHAARFDEFTGMGTTVAGVLVHPDGTSWWFNVGDSRVYRVEGVRLVQVSVDDSPPLPPATDGRPVSTNFITQSLGGHTRGTIVPHVGEEIGAVWLMCTDGLSDLVGVADMEKILAGATNDEAAVYALWQAAMGAGGKDNISVVLARLS